jgi:hypothetical protein
MTDDGHHAGIRSDFGGGGLAAFGRAAIIFRGQFDFVAGDRTALFDGDFDAGLGVNAESGVRSGDDQG